MDSEKLTEKLKDNKEKPVVKIPGYTYCQKCDIFFNTEERLKANKLAKNLLRASLQTSHLVIFVMSCPLCEVKALY